MSTGTTSPKALESSRLSTASPTSRAITVLALASTVLVILGAMPSRNRTNFFSWDVLLLSGFAALLLGLAATASSRTRFETMLERLARRGSLSGIEGLKIRMEKLTQQWTLWVALFLSSLVLLAFVGVMISQPKLAIQRFGLCLFETAWAYVAGHRIGRLLVYGFLGWQLEPAGASIQVFPGHVDGAAGLKPLGSFCLRQALTLAIPAAFLAVWSFLIPAWPDIAVRTRYMVWVHPYLGLLGLALLLEILAFVLPMLWFHREMGNQKQRLLAEADEVSRQIRTLSDQLAVTQSHEDREALKEELSFKTSRFQEIESMPTWPVDVPLVRRFAFTNAPLVLPVVAEVFGLHEEWIKVMEQVLDKSTS